MLYSVMIKPSVVRTSLFSISFLKFPPLVFFPPPVIGNKTVPEIEITWPVTGKIRLFQNPPVDTNIKIKEDNTKLITYQLSRLDFLSEKCGLIACTPK